MADLWERVKKTMTEAYATASERAVEGVNLGVKKLDEATLRRDLAREFAGLGGRVYQLLRKGDTRVGDDLVVRSHMRRLEELDKRLEEKEREIQMLRDQSPGAPGTGGRR
jgi:predicted RNase H-like nuclease (RuvC/YqgF family)